jgi:cell division septation protein DedD
MKVICPKCQYENQASGTRIVCGQCATFIEVKMATDRVPPLTPSEEGGGHRQTTRLPARGAEDPRRGGGRAVRDPYATSIGGDFGDVLDLPATAAGGDILPAERSTGPLTGELWGGGASVEVPSPEVLDEKEKTGMDSDSPSKASLPPAAASELGDPSGGWMDQREGVFVPGSERETRDYFEPPDEVGDNWPLLTERDPTGPLEGGRRESPLEGQEVAEAGKSGVVLRFLLGAVVFAGLIGGAYFFLGDLLQSRQQEDGGTPVAEQAAPAAGIPVERPSPLPGEGPSGESGAQNRIESVSVEGREVPATIGDRGGVKPVDRSESTPIDILPMTGRTGHSEPLRPVAVPGTTPAIGPWTIQVAAFPDQAQASARSEALRGQGVAARVVRADLPGKGTWYRVQLGNFQTREAGMAFGRDLRARGIVKEFLVTSTNR